MWGIITAFGDREICGKKIADKSLVQYQIENLLNISRIDRIVVVSNHSDLLENSLGDDIDTIFINQATNNRLVVDGAENVIEYFAKRNEIEDIIVCSNLYPLITASTLESALDKFYQNLSKALVSFTQTKKYPIWLARPLKEVVSISTNSRSINAVLECGAEYIWNIFALDEKGEVLYACLGFINTPQNCEAMNIKNMATINDTSTLPYIVELKPQGDKLSATLNFDNMPDADSIRFVLKQYCSLDEMRDISKYIVPEHWFVNPITSGITDSKSGKQIFGRQDVQPIYVPNKAFCIIKGEAFSELNGLIAKDAFDYYILSHPANLCVKEPLEFLQAEALLERSLQNTNAR